jgi:polyphosphate glucokinase
MSAETAKPTSPKPATTTRPKGPVTLAIDIGGSGLKAMLLDPAGKAISERQRFPTPETPTPTAVLALLDQLAAALPGFDRISAGFPGVIKRGVVYTAVNLDSGWVEFPLQAELEKRWKKPARVANDASVQGYGAIKGHGVEMVLTVGTGLGSSLYTNGRLCPGLELGHHPWRNHTYEDYIGRRGLEKYGKEKWNKRLQEVIEQTSHTFNWDHLYIGGGNTKKIEFELPKNVSIVSNEEGLLGGVMLWKDDTLSK